MANVKKILIFIVIFTISISNGFFYARTNNVNITKAEELIKERRFKEAKDILTTEYAVDDKNEAYIIKLLEKIELEESKINAKTDAAIKSILNDNNIKAEELLVDLESLKGNFNQKVNNIIDTSEVLNEKLKRINSFYEYIGKAEKELTEFRVDPALENYKSAIDIFRLVPADIKDGQISRIIGDINDFQKTIMSYDIDLKVSFDSSSDPSYDGLIGQYRELEKTVKDIQKLENEILKIKKEYEKYYNEELKTTINYQAYDFIIDAYLSSIRTGIQKKSRWIVDNIFKLGFEEIQNLKESKDGNTSRVDTLYGLLEKDAGYYSFYNPVIDYDANLYLARSDRNVFDYTQYLTKKNKLYYEINAIHIEKDYDESLNYYNRYEERLKARDLKNAENLLSKSESIIKDAGKKMNSINEFLDPYRNLENDDTYKEIFAADKKVGDRITVLENKIDDSLKYVRDSYEKIKALIAEANEKYNTGSTYYRKSDYENAKKFLSEANDRYYEIIAKINDNESDKRIESISKMLKEIENRLYTDDMKLADQKIEESKKSFYNEKYEDASSNLNIAENIYLKYDESSDIIDYYKERILTALKLKSGTQLSSDDPVYYHILELFKDANNAYEIGKKTNDRAQYDTALKFVSQILFEKPYNEEARFLETKILKETDPVAFEQKFQSYFTKAKDLLAKARTSKTKNDYGNALLELQQLKVFDKNTAEINRYITECKNVLEFVPKQLTELDKSEARRLVNTAKNNYKNGNFENALNNVNRAITLWEDVPEARNLVENHFSPRVKEHKTFMYAETSCEVA